MENSVKNKLEKLIFHTAICAGAPQIALMAEEKSPSQISLRPVADAPEWRINMEGMTNAEFNAFLETLAKLVESKAMTVQEAADIIRAAKAN